MSGTQISFAPSCPTSGSYSKGNIVINTNPQELGKPNNKYVIFGWVCTSDSNPITWLTMRVLTGN